MTITTKARELPDGELEARYQRQAAESMASSSTMDFRPLQHEAAHAAGAFEEPEDKCQPGEGGGIALPVVIVVILVAIASTWHIVARMAAA